jgi:hypothetical protein
LFFLASLLFGGSLLRSFLFSGLGLAHTFLCTCFFSLGLLLRVLGFLLDQWYVTRDLRAADFRRLRARIVSVHAVANAVEAADTGSLLLAVLAELGVFVVVGVVAAVLLVPSSISTTKTALASLGVAVLAGVDACTGLVSVSNFALLAKVAATVNDTAATEPGALGCVG